MTSDEFHGLVEECSEQFGETDGDAPLTLAQLKQFERQKGVRLLSFGYSHRMRDLRDINASLALVRNNQFVNPGFLKKHRLRVGPLRVMQRGDFLSDETRAAAGKGNRTLHKR